MAVKKFSEIESGSSISFSAASDVFRIDDEALSAADFGISSPSATTTQFVGGGKTITLRIPIEKLSHTNVKFADGSKLLVGDDSIGTADDPLDNLLVGTAHDDQLIGLAGNDKLNGSVGADSMAGGAGDDIYVVDDEGDGVDENAGEGLDLVRSSVSYTLGDEVENLALTGGAAIDGTGNARDNAIKGNSADNVLHGLGGADTLTGAGGNDTLAYSAADSIDGGGDTDTLQVNAERLDLGGLAGDELKSIEIIDLANATGSLTLTAQQVKDLSDSETLRVMGGGRDSVDASGSWVKGANTVIDDQTYATYTLNGATLLVDTQIDRSGIGVNAAPQGTSATIELQEDSAHAFSADDFGFTDVNAGNTLAAVRIDSLPTFGSLELHDIAVSAGDVIAVGDLGELVFAPAENASGEAYASFTFSVQDNRGAFDPTANTLTFDVVPVNDAPVAADDPLTSVAEDSGTRVISLASLLGNDADGDPELTQTLTLTAVSNAVGGTVQINGTNVEFTPDADFNGSASFDYTLSDGALSDTGSASFTVTAVNDAPLATDDTLAGVAEDSGTRVISIASLLGNDADGDPELSQTLTITAVSNAVGGTVQLNGANVEFTPDADFNGSASFDYTLSDGALTDTGSVSFAVTAVNDAPVATDDTLTGVEEDSGTRVISVASLLGNDADGDPELSQTLTLTSVSNAVGGAVQINGTNIEFTPNAGFSGTASFDYTLGDGALTDTGSVSFAVTAVNEAPPVSEIDLSSLDGANGFRIAGGTASARAGTSASGAGDVDGDGFSDLIVGAPGIGGTYGAGYVVFGKASGFSSSVSVSSLDGSDGFALDAVSDPNHIGGSVAGLGDFNGDGLADFGIGQMDDTSSYVVFGSDGSPGAAFALGSLDGANGLRVDSSDHAGSVIAGAGDINGDGFADVIVGVRNAGASYEGAGYVLFGASSGFGSSLTLADVNGQNGFAIHGNPATYDELGRSVSGAGDFNGDGFGDLIIAAPFSAVGGYAGLSYIVFGAAGGFAANMNAADVDGQDGLRIVGAHGYDYAGTMVSSAGDVNGDGFADVIIGAPGADPHGAGSGAAYVVFGAASGLGSDFNLSALNGTNGFSIAGVAAGDQAGLSVCGAGDVNGDGYDDVLVGASRADAGGADSGAAYLIYGAASGLGSNVELSALDGVNGFRITGASAGDLAGNDVSAAGDVNGDGFADLIVGAPLASAGGAQSGAGYVIYGGDFNGEAQLVGSAGSDTLTGGGTDAFHAGAGNDRIQLADGATFFRADGGAGTDTLALLGSSDLLDFTALDANAARGIEKIDLGNAGNTLKIEAVDLLNLSDTSNLLVVDGGGTSIVDISSEGGWTLDGTSGGYYHYSNGEAKLDVATAISVLGAT